MHPLTIAQLYLTHLFADVTVEVYTLSLKERTKLKGLLEVVSSSAEFETIPIRRHEDVLLRRIYDRVPVKLEKGGLGSAPLQDVPPASSIFLPS